MDEPAQGTQSWPGACLQLGALSRIAGRVTGNRKLRISTVDNRCFHSLTAMAIFSSLDAVLCCCESFVLFLPRIRFALTGVL
jgi:hypothetical protein